MLQDIRQHTQGTAAKIIIGLNRDLVCIFWYSVHFSEWRR